MKAKPDLAELPNELQGMLRTMEPHALSKEEERQQKRRQHTQRQQAHHNQRQQAHHNNLRQTYPKSYLNQRQDGYQEGCQEELQHFHGVHRERSHHQCGRQRAMKRGESDCVERR